MLEIGKLRLDLLRDGSFRLDGGAMFGVVPRPLWERKKPPDDRNRVNLALNCLLVRGPERTVLIDTGIGDKWNDKLRDIYAIDRSPGIEAELQRVGVAAEDIDLVVLSHLHFDHAGGNTRLRADGAYEPAFPRARYVVQKGHLLEEALVSSELRRASHLPENFVPIKELDRFDLVEGDCEVAPGISTVLTGGHQKFHQAVRIEGGGKTVLFPADLVPTAAHLPPPYIMAYDHFPLDTLAMKKRLLSLAAANDWILVLEHEDQNPVGCVVRDGKSYSWEPVAH
ncbi:MBL fold metallo-hydrolase [Planctomycetota bacterium]